MSVRPLFLLAVALMGAAVAVALPVLAVTVTRPRRERASAAAARLPALRRLVHTQNVARGLALVAGIGVSAVAASTWTLGRGLMLAPAAFAAAQIVAVLVSDRLTYDVVRSPGVAGLEVRRFGDYAPRGLVVLTSLTTLALAAALTWTTAVASPDDLGRAGRALAYRCAQGCDVGRITPWPGSFYSVPLAVGLGVVLLLALTAVTITVRRPRNGSDPLVTDVDDAVRRHSVETVVASVGLAASASLAGIALVAGVRVVSRSELPDGGSLVAGGTLLTVGGLASTVILLWCIVSLLLPGAGVVRDPAEPVPAGQVGGRKE